MEAVPKARVVTRTAQVHYILSSEFFTYCVSEGDEYYALHRDKLSQRLRREREDVLHNFRDSGIFPEKLSMKCGIFSEK